MVPRGIGVETLGDANEDRSIPACANAHSGREGKRGQAVSSDDEPRQQFALLPLRERLRFHLKTLSSVDITALVRTALRCPILSYWPRDRPGFGSPDMLIDKVDQFGRMVQACPPHGYFSKSRLDDGGLAAALLLTGSPHLNPSHLSGDSGGRGGSRTHITPIGSPVFKSGASSVVRHAACLAATVPAARPMRTEGAGAPTQ